MSLVLLIILVITFAFTIKDSDEGTNKYGPSIEIPYVLSTILEIFLIDVKIKIIRGRTIVCPVQKNFKYCR
jgi:hypothetical protein